MEELLLLEKVEDEYTLVDAVERVEICVAVVDVVVDECGTSTV